MRRMIIRKKTCGGFTEFDCFSDLIAFRMKANGDKHYFATPLRPAFIKKATRCKKMIRGITVDDIND